jgi:uncharacterized protein (DUF433 family)
MNLPDFLEEMELGDIRVRGHRIDLCHIIEDYNDGFSPEALHEQFPTLSPEVIAQVLAFYKDNRDEVDAYVARCQKEIERLRATTPRALDWDELRRRREAKRQAEAK